MLQTKHPLVDCWVADIDKRGVALITGLIVAVFPSNDEMGDVVMIHQFSREIDRQGQKYGEVAYMENRLIPIAELVNSDSWVLYKDQETMQRRLDDADHGF